MKKCPILFVDHANAVGGAEHSLLLLLKNLDNNRWGPHLACIEGDLANTARNLGVPVYILSFSKLRRSAQAITNWRIGTTELTKLAQQLNAVALYGNTVRASFYAAPASKIARIPFIWHMRDFWLSESKPGTPWGDSLGKQLLCQTATQIIVNSYAVAAHLPSLSRVTVIHNGIEAGVFDPALDGALFRREHGIPLDVPLVGMVGRLRPWKGQERFLRVAAQILQSQPDARFTLVGGDPFHVDDDYGKYLQRLIGELALNDQVIFTGHLNDVRFALAAMDIFVHPGDPEPFGLVNIEAMAMAKPVVSFAHGALPEIVVDGQTGVLVQPIDETAMAEALIDLLSTPLRREKMGKAGRSRVVAQFTIKRVASQVEAVLKTVISS